MSSDAVKNIEFRYYEIPNGEEVLALIGPTWHKQYGEGRSKLHFHNLFEIGICYEGEGEMTLGERTISFHPGYVSMIPPSEVHTTNTFGKTARWEWLYFDMDSILIQIYQHDEITRDIIKNGVLSGGNLIAPESNTEKLHFIIQCIFDEARKKEYMHKTMVHHFLCMMTIEAIRLSKNPLMHESGSLIGNILPAIKLIRDNYGTNLRISSLARECGMSETHFRKTFESYMNMKPLDYINFVRIQNACKLLHETDLMLLEIAELVGYEVASTFIRNFKKVMGITPHQWRISTTGKNGSYTKYNVTALQGWME